MAAVLTAVRDLGRLRDISLVLMKHGFGEVLGRMGLGALLPSAALVDGESERRKIAWPERIRMVLEDLGPSFMKLGQVASTRPELLPKELVDQLRKLQDSVPPVAFEAIRAELESSLSAPLSDVFSWFDERALAAATIGQVHRARLRAKYDNDTASPQERDVVVKVQRPGVRATIERDLELLHFLAAVLERSIAEARVYDPVGLVAQFDRSITAELDYISEGSNADRFRSNFEGYEGIAFPVVFKAASTKQVLVTELFDGRSIDQALAAGMDGKKLAKRAVGIVVKMIFEDGFFHADPHPGNIILLGSIDEPTIGLIDLGMVGRFSPELRDKTVRLLVGVAREDSLAVADALYALGRPTKKIDMVAFRSEVALLAERYVGRSLRDVQLSSLIRDLVDTAVRFGMEIPTDFMMVAKALMTLEGIGKQLDPDLDVFEESKPYFFELLRKRISPREIGNDVWRGLERFADVARDLPAYLVEVLDDLRMGRLQIQTTDTQSGAVLDRLGRRLFSGMVVASLNVAAGLALVSEWRYRIWAAGTLFAASWIAWAAHVSKDAVKTWWAKGKPRL